MYKIVTKNKIDFTNKENLLNNIGFPIENKQVVLQYLQSEPTGVTTWLEKDVLKGEDIVQDHTLFYHDDGEYKWSELEIFYFKNYDLLLSDEFIKKACGSK